MSDRCSGCRNENRPCRYKNMALTRRRCSHYVSRHQTSSKKEEKYSYAEWFKRHKVNGDKK